MSGIATTRASAAWVEGMDACIRGLGYALSLTEQREPEADLTYLANEVEAIRQHWEGLRGELPPDPDEQA
jgi:hypothetical protein